MPRRPLKRPQKYPNSDDSDERILLATSEKFIEKPEEERVLRRTLSKKQPQYFPDLEDIGYLVLDHLGCGTYGVVYLAEHLKTRQRVAVKRSGEILLTNGVPTDVLREVSLLRSIRHENILELFDIKVFEKFVYMIMEYCDVDLHSVLQFYNPRNQLPEGLIRSILRQLTNGLLCMHSQQMAHRDLKPQNILMKFNGVVKIADFGLCRYMDAPTKLYTNEVVTLHYRPPELLLGGSSYGCFVDMWAVGCILAELIEQKVLFKASSEIDLIRCIFRILPIPSRESWPMMDEISQCYNPYLLAPEPHNRVSLQSEVPKMNKSTFKIFEKLLSVHPLHRMTAFEMSKTSFVLDVPIFPLDRGLYYKRNR